MKIPFILALLASGAFAQAQDWQKLAGDGSRIAAPRAVVVTNPGAWDVLWREHAGDGVPAPAVDFAQEKVVAVFLGRRGRTGYKVALEADASNPAEVVVSYAEQAPKASFGATMVTTPFVFQKVAARQVRLVTKEAGSSAKPAAAAPAPAPSAPMGVSAELSGVKASVARMSDLRDAVASAAAFDGSAVRTAANGPEVGKLLAQLPPPPGAGGQDTVRGAKPLPPPPGSGNGGDRGGKPLPPPPGQGGEQGGKPLPPPPGTGKPLPPPPGVRHPQPEYPGGPLSKGDHRLADADRTYTTQGMVYVGYWFNGTEYAADRGVVKVGPQDAGKSYILRLDSPQVQKYAKFYYDPSDGQYYWVPDSDRTGRVVSRRIEVTFGARTLQPWEREEFTFSLDGRDLRLESQNGAYRYSAQSTTDLQDPERVYVTMTPGQKLLTAPDHNGVSARLEDIGGTLTLVVEDRWAAEYAGETVELAFVIRKDDGSFWSRDPVVLQASANGPYRMTGARQDFTVTTGSGKFYLESWSFRRAASKISSGGWVGKGQGNTVKK